MLKSAIGEEGNQRIDYLILNAAGGLENNKPEDWPVQINVHSQDSLVSHFLPFMNPGGKIIYLTSLWAHGYGDMKQLPAYGPIASSKNRFEREFRDRIPELQEWGVDVGVVVGHVIKGTAAHTLFSRSAKEELAKLEGMTETGQFPEAADMGNAVRDMLVSGFESGHTVYVGGKNAERIQRPDRALTREEIRAILPHVWRC